MADFAGALGASKAASTLLVLFIPSRDRHDQAIDQGHWVEEALRVLGTLFGGATAFPQGRGVWRDDAQGGKLLFDEPVVVQCYTSEETLDQQADRLRDFLVWMGREARQGAVGVVIDRDYLGIRFPRPGGPGPGSERGTGHGEEHGADCPEAGRRDRVPGPGRGRRRLRDGPAGRDHGGVAGALTAGAGTAAGAADGCAVGSSPQGADERRDASPAEPPGRV